MKDTLLITFLSLLTVCGMRAQTALPYFTGFDNATEQNGWNEVRIGDINPFYMWDYEAFGAFSAPNLLIHYYPVGGMDPVDDWFVSPAFNFSNGGQIDSIRFAFTGFGLPMAGDTVAIYLLNGSDDPATATRTKLIEFVDTLYVADDTWRRMDSIAIPASAGESHIAFRYYTTNNWLDVKFDNLAISGNQPTGIISHQLSNNITLYPNPTNGQVKLSVNAEGLESEKLVLKIYDQLGKLVEARSLTANRQLEITQPGGMYFYRVENTSGTLLKTGKLAVR